MVGALIYPGLCLNLTDYGVIEQLRAVLRARGPDKPQVSPERRLRGSAAMGMHQVVRLARYSRDA